MSLHVVGVRHHSPACARLVAHTIRTVRPAHVLIEGPSDMNARLGELRLPHVLPVAVFTHVASGGDRWASWSPFCAYSPEWVALHEAAAAGAEARFIDLPAWDDAFRPIRNRYADRHDRASRLVDHLCARLGMPDFDALWDHLFEQEEPPEVLAPRLHAYFEELRGNEPGDACDGPREAFMSRFVAAALRREDGPVVVVCGGYHAPMLERAWRDVEAGGGWPVPVAPSAQRFGSSVVPYSYHRLDSFTGYEAGMPSPEYHDAVWTGGAEKAAEAMMTAVARRLRQKRQVVSSADLVAARATAEALRRLRGHLTTARTDLLDGLASALVKDALDVPLPWTYRGRLRPRTDPVLVEVMAAFSGERVGRLAPGTPLPALLADARAELETHGLSPAADPRLIELRLADDDERAKSRVLHRLRVLGVPGFDRMTDTTLALVETWRLVRSVDAEAALIESASYGGTLQEAAGARLEEELEAARGRLGGVATLLLQAALAGIGTLASRALDVAARAASSEPSLAELGEGLGRLFGLWRHDVVLGVRDMPALAVVIAAAWERGLVLAEAVRGVGAPADPPQVDAVRQLRDVMRHGADRLGLDVVRGHAVLDRVVSDAEAPPALRGAALGMLWSTGFFPDDDGGATRAGDMLRAMATPRTLGDALAGLLALAREEVLHAPRLLHGLDGLIDAMDETTFLQALPSLRLAFAYLPPGEKESLARAITTLRGPAASEAPGAQVADQLRAQAAAFEAAAAALGRRYGLLA